ncbi:hypothetical protein HaLaN_10119, partial [Haematococcus lacustris]
MAAGGHPIPLPSPHPSPAQQLKPNAKRVGELSQMLSSEQVSPQLGSPLRPSQSSMHLVLLLLLQLLAARTVAHTLLAWNPIPLLLATPVPPQCNCWTRITQPSVPQLVGRAAAAGLLLARGPPIVQMAPGGPSSVPQLAGEAAVVPLRSKNNRPMCKAAAAALTQPRHATQAHRMPPSTQQ